MDYTTGIKPISALRAHASEMVHKARESGQPIVITQNGIPTAVLQDVETYQRQRDQLLMLRLLMEGERDYRQGNTVSHDEAQTRFQRKLAGMKKSAETL